MEKQKVTVRGYVERRRVLKVVRRSGRRAEFWAFPYHSEHHPYAAAYLDESNFTSSHNYYRHGYNDPLHGYFPDLPYSTIDDRITYHFSDENVHACSIMWPSLCLATSNQNYTSISYMAFADDNYACMHAIINYSLSLILCTCLWLFHNYAQ